MAFVEVVKDVRTPAFVVDLDKLEQRLKYVKAILPKEHCHLLFPVKCFSIASVLSYMTAFVDGFAVSSPFEARLARDIVCGNKSVHFMSPGLREEDAENTFSICDYITFNSLSQLRRFQEKFENNKRTGLRINPQLSFITDDRYNPCCDRSKLGVPLTYLKAKMESISREIHSIGGIHFHSNCESSNFDELKATTLRISGEIPDLLMQAEWINLGGGYMFRDSQGIEVLEQTTLSLIESFSLDVFVEPGRGIIEDSGFIVSKVVDRFEYNGINFAVLDTSVNHMPEVLEFSYQPAVSWANRCR